MKTLILSINSRFTHTLLAPRYLKANCKALSVDIIETNVNIRLFDLLEEVYQKAPDVIAVSCYIFNIDYVRRFLDEIKLILPNVKIILGGYEVTFDIDRYLPLCDYIIKGEGDFIFNELLWDIFRQTNNFPKVIEAGTVKDLNKIASPFTEEYCKLGNERILYMETSRGCPYSCSYCMSANTHGVRSFNLDRIFSDFDFIMQYQPKQIKMVDRTFNYDKKRATKIFKYIIDNFTDTNTNFHFEMAPELFDEEMFCILENAKKGLLQFEIGIQSYNLETLKNVGRNAEISIIEKNLSRLIAMQNINIHVDLIAGLPMENLESFKSGFNRLFNLKPNCLQLGFLKILKGSKIYNNKEGYKTYNSPPYEIISTPNLSFNDVLELKTVEEMLELYYNSDKFYHSINFLLPQYFNPYEFFYSIGKYCKEKGYKKNLSANFKCDILFDFVSLKFKEIISDEQYTDLANKLKNLINQDYARSGNVRKWKK